MLVSEQIITGCLNKDRKAQRELYELCYSYMVGIAKRYMPNEDEVMEVITESFLKIIKRVEIINEQDSPIAWIRRVTINTAIDLIRSRKKYFQNTKFQNNEQYNQFEHVYVELNTIDKTLDANYIQNIIQQLPDISREVLNLFAIDGFSHKEIGEILKITEEQSRWHVFKARKIVAEKINNYQEGTILKYKK